jgi:ferredoxin
MQEVAEMGLGVVVMGPVGGGRLGIPSDKIEELTGGEARGTVEAALRFVWAHPSKPVALSGMENMEMLEQNVQLAEQAEPFTEEQVEGINSLVRARLEKSGLYCSGCGYCLEDCPAGVKIPQNLDLLNQARIFGLKDAVQGRYKRMSGKAVLCVACGRCLEKCPQNIDIPEKLRETVATLDPDFGRVEVSTRVADLNPAGDEDHGRFTLAVTGHNISESLRHINLQLNAAGGVELEEDEILLEHVKPFERFRRKVQGTFPAGTRELPMALKALYEDATAEEDATYEFVVLPAGLDEDWDSGDWCEAAPTADDFSKAEGDAQELADRHGLCFKLSYDDEGLVLLVDVRDDLLRPSSPDQKGQADGLELFLDGRKSADVGKKKYTDGVYQVILFPGTPGEQEAFFKCKKDIELDVTSEFTDDGYRMTVRVPFESFCVQEGRPERIGFDLAANTCNEDGKRIAQWIWAGEDDNWQNAANFRDFWLVS